MFETLEDMKKLLMIAFKHYTPVKSVPKYTRSLHDFLNYYGFRINSSGVFSKIAGKLRETCSQIDITATIRFPESDFLLFEKLLFETVKGSDN